MVFQALGKSRSFGPSGWKVPFSFRFYVSAELEHNRKKSAFSARPEVNGPLGFCRSNMGLRPQGLPLPFWRVPYGKLIIWLTFYKNGSAFYQAGLFHQRNRMALCEITSSQPWRRLHFKWCNIVSKFNSNWSIWLGRICLIEIPIIFSVQFKCRYTNLPPSSWTTCNHLMFSFFQLLTLCSFHTADLLTPGERVERIHPVSRFLRNYSEKTTPWLQVVISLCILIISSRIFIVIRPARTIQFTSSGDARFP